MRTYKTIDQANETYGPLGVHVHDAARTADKKLLPTHFNCLDCGLTFSPDAKKVRNRHQCPNGCNKGKTL